MESPYTIEVLIDGQKIDFHNVVINQTFNWHHSFRISISSESIEGKNAYTIDNSASYVGKTVEVTAISNKLQTGDGLKFKGIITSVNIDRSFSTDSLIILSGYSPTYMMEDGIHCETYNDMKLDEIFSSVLSKYPGNLINPVNEMSDRNPKLPYTVQYKETNYQFLTRLAANYGHWFCYDGTKIHFGQMKEAGEVEVLLGRDLRSFEYGVSIKPTKFKVSSYDYKENKLLSEGSGSYTPTLDKYAKDASNIADNTFNNEGMFQTPLYATKQDELKSIMQARKGGLVGDMTTLRGSSTNPSIVVNAHAKVSAVKKTGSGNDNVFIGRFRVIGVTHHINSSWQYSNEFQALPVSVVIPPMNPRAHQPTIEVMPAVVTSNEDPDHLGRVQVRLNWQDSGDTSTPFIRLASAHAWGDRGFYFVPEVGDEVMVDFENGNPSMPFVASSLYHGKKSPEFARDGNGGGENNIKSIKTRSGHTIKFVDEEGKEFIEIFDAKDNKIILDSEKEMITISSVKKMVFESKDIEIKASNDFLLEAGNNMNIKVTKKMETKAMDIKTGASNKLDLSGDMGATLKTNMKLDLSGGTGASLKSNLNTEIGGTAGLALKTAAVAQLQGSLVKIN